jgi:endoglucanase
MVEKSWSLEPQPAAFFQKLLETPSPSGFEAPIQEVVREYVSGFADHVETDLHGNVIACCNPKGKVRVLLAGHCDQIGMLVSYIDELGFVYTQTIGGWDPQQLIGQRVTVWAKQGPLHGVIARKPIHLLNDDERKQVVKTQDLWIDVGVASRDEAQKLIRVGDPVTLALGYQPMRNDLANSPGMDDKTGLWVVMEALRRAKTRGLSCALYAVSTVQEEIGLRGARTSTHSIDPHIGIAVDVTHATDCPTIDKRQNGEVGLGKGPVIARGPNVNPVVVDQLISTCDDLDIPFQLAGVGRAMSNDANSIQVSRGGVATASVAIPNRYMHSAVETISLRDIDYAANLLAAFACGVTDAEVFKPTAELM